FFHQPSHSGTLDIIGTNGRSLAQHRIDPGIIFEPLDLVDIYFGTSRTVLPYDFNGVLDLGQAPLSQDVEFEYSYILGNDHVKLYRWKPFRGEIGRRMIMDGFFQDQDPCGMYAQIIWETGYKLSVFEDQGTGRIQWSTIQAAITELIDLLFWKSEHLPQFPGHGPGPKGVVGAQQCHMGKPFKNIGGHRFPVPPIKIDIKIG